MFYLIVSGLLVWGVLPCGLWVLYFVFGKPFFGVLMDQHESTAAAFATFRGDVLNAIRSFPRRHWFLTVWLLAIAGFNVAITPINNPFAQDAITIRGRFPFDQGFELVFRQNAYGNAQWYRRWCGGIQTDNAICRAGFTYLKPTRTEAQHYVITIYRDRYFPLFADWKEETWHVQYKANAADLERFGATSYGNPGNSVCYGSDEALSKRDGRLYCHGQPDDKEFKSLVLTDGQPVDTNEKLMNFWLDSELRQIKNQGNEK
jgi:hypothetical protein